MSPPSPHSTPLPAHRLSCRRKEQKRGSETTPFVLSDSNKELDGVANPDEMIAFLESAHRGLLDLPARATCQYIRQPGARGLTHQEQFSSIARLTIATPHLDPTD